MAAPRILTFNFHEPYLCLLARTGYPLTVGYYEDTAVAQRWETRYRPVPGNVTLFEERVWRGELEGGGFDVAIAHNEANAVDVFRACLESGTSLVLVCHNRARFVCSTLEDKPNAAEELRAFEGMLERLRERVEFVFISESKRDDYGIPGTVILPGIEVADYGAYTGQEPRILRVGNMMRARDQMFDVGFQERVCEGMPCRVVGDNPGIAGSRPAASFDELRGIYRDLRCMLHVTREDWEDGYNLSMLEAMATGMPVVALANRTSPLTDGVDGFVGADVQTLQARLGQLLADRDLAEAMGARGRETVAREFPMGRFVERWRDVIENAAQRASAGKATHSSTPPQRVRMEDITIPRHQILVYWDEPASVVGRCFAEAYAGDHDVVTMGPQGAATGGAVDHLDWQEGRSCEEALREFPDGFVPELFVWIQYKTTRAPVGTAQLPGAKVCFLTAEHLPRESSEAIAREFDLAFVSRVSCGEDLASAGARHLFHVPLRGHAEATEGECLDEAGAAERVLMQSLEALGRLGGTSGEARYLYGGYYCYPRLDLLEHVPSDAQRVLDVGCAAGEFGRILKGKGVQEVVGIELDERAARMAGAELDDVVQGNVEEMELPFADGYFDCITCGDVLEHLVDPWAALAKLKRVLAPGGVFVISVPNVCYQDMLLSLALGRWTYLDHGILDRTHLRFFTTAEVRKMAEGAGLEIVKLQPLCILAPEKLPLDEQNCVNLPLLRIGPLTRAQYAELRTYQILLMARKPVAGALEAALRALAEKDYERAHRLAESADGEDDVERKRVLAKAGANLGRLEEAESLYRELLEQEPDDAEGAADLGLVLVASGRAGEARPLFERALAADPASGRALGGLGLVALSEEDKETALEYFGRSLEADFDSEVLLGHLVQTAEGLGRPEAAEAHIRRFVDFYPGNAAMVCRHASILHGLGRSDEALERLDALLLLAPGHEEASRLRNRIRGEAS